MKIVSRARRATVVLAISCLLMPQLLWAQKKAIDESPNEFAMVGDLIVARPVGLVMTVAGAVVWVVSLPFTLLAGHAAEAGDTLVIGPAKTTFWRCLGCRDTGYVGNKGSEQDSSAEQELAES
jgi:hypothetical protein